MAKDNKENPDEGTPRSKKDIRRERRQMKAVNASRPKYSYTPEGKRVKSTPLYSKQEIKDVEKPFKAEPGKALSGTIGGVTYNDPNKPTVSETTYEYQRSGGGKEKSIGPTTITKEQATALNSEDVNAGAKVREVLESAVTPNSTETTQNTLQTTLEKKPDLTLNELEKGTQLNIEVGNEVNNTEKAITKEEVENKTKLQEIVEGPQQYNWTDTYVTTGFEPESPEDINARAANAARQKAPQLVIEKLGIQDYYPEIGRDIAVGNFSGSYAGSRTIYSGAGGLLPLGLYDARKRAIATEIKRKEALMDQLKDMPDIAKQYKPAFAQDFYEGLQDYVSAYKDNPDGLASDPGFLKWMANKKSVAENFTKTDAYLKDLESKLVDPKTGEPAAWVPTGMLKIINNVKTGMVPGKIDDYFSGKKNIAKVLDTVRALPDALNQADDIIKTLIEKGGVETAINLKTGKDFTENDIKELNSLVQQINSPSPDYEMFSELKRKFFEFEYDKMAEEWVKMHMQDQPKSVQDEVQKSMASYIESQMPQDAIISTITSRANDAAERLNAQLDYQSKMADINAQNWRFEKEYEKHNSATYGQIQAMEESGIKETSLGIANPVVGAKSTMDKEYEVWMVDTKGKWRQDFVPAKEIMDANERAREKGKSGMYFSDKGKSAFIVPDSGYFGVTQNNMKKEGNNYNGQQYGVMFNKVFNQNTQEDEYVPNKVRFRTSKTTIVQNGVRNKAAEQTYNVSAGQNPAWQMADTEGRGGTTTQKEVKGSFIKTNN
jgi:hypothetical protein